jgi:dUTP pyrophosphatase
VLRVEVRVLDPGLPLPSYAHEGDAGADLVAREDAVILHGGGRYAMPTGIAVAIPDGYVGLVQPRSGLAARHGVTQVNTPGTVDAGFRGELRVILINTDPEHDYEVKRGDRIAQLLVQQVERCDFVPVETLSDSLRGEGGFGSSGR